MAGIRDHLRGNIVGYLALFVALGGVSYAAISLPAKSVGTNHLKANAVVSSKVKNGSLRSADFGVGQLPAGPQGAPGATGATGPQGLPGATGQTGPAGSPDTPQQVLGKLAQVDGVGSGLNADEVDGLDSADFVQREGAIFTAVTLPGNGCNGSAPWVHSLFGTPNRVAYFRDFMGFVHLRGEVFDCPGLSGPILTLPVGYRPLKTEHQIGIARPTDGSAPSFGRIEIATNGDVNGQIAGTATLLSLDGVYFRCAPSGESGCP